MSRERLTRVGAVVLGGALLTTLAGCGGESAVSSDRAKSSVTSAGQSLRATVNRPGFYDVVTAWKSAVKLVPDPTCTSDDAGSRWRLVGGATVEDKDGDGDGAVATLIGALPDSWDTANYVGDLDDDPTLVLPATYGSGKAAVAAEITIVPVRGGWTYSLSARSACTAS